MNLAIKYSISNPNYVYRTNLLWNSAVSEISEFETMARDSSMSHSVQVVVCVRDAGARPRPRPRGRPGPAAAGRREAAVGYVAVPEVVFVVVAAPLPPRAGRGGSGGAGLGSGGDGGGLTHPPSSVGRGGGGGMVVPEVVAVARARRVVHVGTRQVGLLVVGGLHQHVLGLEC